MLPSDAVHKMRDQHEHLRALIRGTDTLLKGPWLIDELRASVAAVGQALRSHNKEEEAYIVPFLADLGRVGTLHTNQMEAQHRAEHARLLTSVELPLRSDALTNNERDELERALADLRTHMDIEERRFLNDDVIHDFIRKTHDAMGG